MNESKRLAGVLAPVVTPFKADLSPDAARLARHCRWLLAQGCGGLAVFGTNSEANSLSAAERMALLEAVVEKGIDPARLMPGTGCCALTDSVALTAHAVKLGCAGALMLPPFYYKGVTDDGLYRSFAEIIERVGDSRLHVYLYHIPPVSQIPITLGLIERLIKSYPKTIVGIKDSSGDWSNTEAVLKAFPGFDVFAGSEEFLLATLRHGGAGCITAGGNVNPAAIHKLYEAWRSEDADKMQKEITDFRMALQRYPMIPALKSIIAHYAGDPAWTTVRPPLVELKAEEASALIAGLKERRFAMPGIKD